MKIPFETTDWNSVASTHHVGTRGVAHWKTIHHPGLRIRLVEYSPDYLADHWCEKGHILFCLEGEMVTELRDGRKFTLTKNVSYQVSDALSSHRTHSQTGATLFIIDGDFLQ